MKDKKNKTKVYFLLVVVILLVVFSLYIQYTAPLQTKTINVKFSIGKNIGIIADTGELNFGRVILSSSSVKIINLTNFYKFPVRVNILVSKNLENFIFSDYEFLLEPNETIEVPFSLIISSNENLGNYFGDILFEFRKL